MAKGYQQLTYEQRCQISALKTSGQRPAAIAAQLWIHRSTIGRELKRNTGLRGYRYKQAHETCRGEQRIELVIRIQWTTATWRKGDLLARSVVHGRPKVRGGVTLSPFPGNPLRARL